MAREEQDENLFEEETKDPDEVSLEPEDKEDPPEPGEPKRLTRQQKKNKRGFDWMKERTEVAEASSRRAEEEASRLRVEVASLRAQPKPKEDTLDGDIQESITARQRLYENYQSRHAQGSMTSDEEQKYLKDANELEEKTTHLRFKKYRKEEEGDRDPVMEEKGRQLSELRQRHWDVYNNPNARIWAEGYYNQKKAKGTPDSAELVEEAMDEARREFRLGNYRPDESTRSRFSGPSRGTTASTKTPKTLKMTTELKMMADAAYAHVKDPSERYKMWAQENGKEFLEMESKG